AGIGAGHSETARTLTAPRRLTGPVPLATPGAVLSAPVAIDRLTCPLAAPVIPVAPAPFATEKRVIALVCDPTALRILVTEPRTQFVQEAFEERTLAPTSVTKGVLASARFVRMPAFLVVAVVSICHRRTPPRRDTSEALEGATHVPMARKGKRYTRTREASAARSRRHAARLLGWRRRVLERLVHDGLRRRRARRAHARSRGGDESTLVLGRPGATAARAREHARRVDEDRRARAGDARALRPDPGRHDRDRVRAAASRTHQ